MNDHLREIADCLDEALRLQSRVMDLTEQVYEGAGISPGGPDASGEGDWALLRAPGASGGAQSPGPRRCLKPPLRPPASMGCIEVASVGSRSTERGADFVKGNTAGASLIGQGPLQRTPARRWGVRPPD